MCICLKVVSKDGKTKFFTEEIDSVDAAMRRVYKKLHALRQLGEKVIFANVGEDSFKICFSIDANGRYRKIPFCWAHWMYEKFIGKKIVKGDFLPEVNDNLDELVDQLLQAMVA